MLSLIPVQIIGGLIDWICATFVLPKPIIIENSFISYASLAHYNRAKKVVNVLKELR